MSLFDTKARRNFNQSFYSLAYLLLLKTNKKNVFRDNKNILHFNWGLIWSALNPLILIIGLSILVSFGIRGRAFQLEYIVFLFMYWFAFTQIVSSMVNLEIDESLVSRKFIAPWLIFLVSFFLNLSMLFIRFLIVYIFMIFMGFILQPFHLLSTMFLLSFFALFYGVIASTIIHGNSFLQDMHGYLMQGLFFTSSIIIPITRMPEAIRDVLVFNPLVHIMEWTKAPTSGISYSYIDLGYFLNFFIVLLVMFPIFLYLKNNLCLSKQEAV